MRRKITDYLIWWKNLGKEKMPLLIYGARQIGKTYLLRDFGANYYKNTVYMNFETEPVLTRLFSDSIDPKKLIPKIEQFYSVQIIPGDTLIIFDEIQSCNRALTSLKYFCEEAPEYDVVGAGSLLGVHTSSTDYSFPVGKVISKMMYPMNFEEFLWESDNNIFTDIISDCFSTDSPIDNSIHESLLGLYREYLLVGGMPLAVYNYFKNDRILSYKDIQKIVLDTYVSDMTKYTSNSQAIKTINTFDSIVPQLAKENKKFQFKMIAKGARAGLFGESIDWLVRAGIVNKCDRVTTGGVLPNIVKDLSAFKLYMCDVGLVSYKANLSNENMGVFDNTFMGGIVENFVANTLINNGYELFYWESDASAEVDFIIVKDDKIIPIEVKSGINVRSYSLNSYIRKYEPEYAIRVSTKNFGHENGIKSIPLYASYLL